MAKRATSRRSRNRQRLAELERSSDGAGRGEHAGERDAGELGAAAAGAVTEETGSSSPSSAAASSGDELAGDAAAAEAATGSVGALAVEVDRPALIAEAAAIAAAAEASSPASLEQALTAPSSAPAIAADPIAAQVAEITPSVRLLVAQSAAAFAPAWEVSKTESDGVADALALTLAHWLPAGAIEPKYLAALSLAGAIYAVADTRREKDGSFKPLRIAPRPTPAASSSPSSPSSPPHLSLV